MARPVGTATISFGLVNIPVQIYSAVAPQRVGFNLLHKTCGHRLKQRMLCPIDNVTVAEDEIVRGFEHGRDQYVTFSEEELKALEAERTNLIELVEFVPEHTVDLLYVEDSRYLGPDKNAARPYSLLFQALARAKKLAVGRFSTRGKTHLVLVRAFKKGLVLHNVYYADEVRSFDDVPFAKIDGFDLELDAALKLVNATSSKRFDPTKYTDTWRTQVLAAVEQKVAGQEVTAPVAEAPKAAIIDLLEALKRSVASLDERPANETAADHAGAALPPPPSEGPRPGPAKVAARAKRKKTGST